MPDFFNAEQIARDSHRAFNTDIKAEISAIDESIKSSYTQPLAPMGSFKSNIVADSGFAFGSGLKDTTKASFESRNYNIDDAYATLRSGEMIKKYDTYKEGRDNEEYAAQTQSTAEKWAHGVAKFVGQIGTGIVGGTIGNVYGAIQWAKEGSFRASYDNDFMNYLDDLNEKLDYKLANHYSKAEKEAGFFGSLGSANFWAKDLLGGAAFTVSAIGSEAIWAWATGGTSLATTMARAEMRAARLFGMEARAAQAAQKLAAMNKAKDLTLKPIRSAFMNTTIPTRGAVLAGKTGEFINSARFLYTSAGYEAGFEARTFIRERKEAFESSFIAENGRPPSADETKKFDEDLTKSANYLYGFNMAIVGSSNFVTMGKNIFGLRNPLKVPNKWTNAKLFGAGTKLVDGKIVALATTKAQKAARVAWGLSESALIEGVWEEGMQSVGSNTAKNWIESTYNPKYMGGTMDLSQAFTQGLSDTYGTKEGMKEVGIGMLIGGLMGIGTKVAKRQSITSEFKAIDSQSEGLSKFSDRYTQDRIQELFSYSGRVQSSTKSQDEANQKGDFVGGEHARTSAILAQVTFAHNLDYVDQTIADTEIAINNIDNSVLMKEYNIDKQGAEKLKGEMIQEFKDVSATHSKNMEFSEYILGNKLTKDEKKELGDFNLKSMKEALAYELTMGERVHEFSSDLLHAIKDQVGQTFASKDLTDSLSIEDILVKAGKEAKKEAFAKEKEIKSLAKEKTNLQREHQQIEKTLNNTVDIEAKKVHLNKIDSIMSRISEIDMRRDELVKEYNIMLKSANLKNPFGKNVDEILIDANIIENRENNIQRIKELIDEHKNIDPQQATKLAKLIEEYGKSIYSFKRYSDLARQLYDPKLGLRGKRNIISELRKEKGVSEVTVEFLEGLKSSSESRVLESGMLEDAIIGTSEEVRDIISRQDGDKEVKPGEEGEDGAIIPAKTDEQRLAEKEAEIQRVNEEYDKKVADASTDASQAEPSNTKETERLEKERKVALDKVEKRYTPATEAQTPGDTSATKTIKEYITDLIKESPYLLDYYGSESAPSMPSQEDMDEFTSLATRALADPKISAETISFKSPYGNSTMPQKGKNLVALSKEEVLRLQELNEVLSNWQLLEVYGNSQGVSIAEMLLQDSLLESVPSADIKHDEVTDREFSNLADKTPKTTDTGEGIRNSEVLQIPVSAHVSNSSKATNIHGLTLGGLVLRLNASTIRYEKIDSKTRKPIVSETRDNVKVGDLNTLAGKGARFTILLEDGTSATIGVSSTGALVFNSSGEFSNIISQAGLEVRGLTSAQESGYLDIYDLQTDDKLATDYDDADTYTPSQLYQTKPGQSVFFNVDTTNKFNAGLLDRYRNNEITLEKFIDDLKIDIVDSSNNKVGSLKANHGISNMSNEFLNIRKKAADTLLGMDLDYLPDTLEIPVSSKIKWVFLGSPTLNTEDGSLKLHEIEPSKVVDYGYIENGKLVLKNGSASKVRKDYISKVINKNRVPIVVFKQGEYLVAFPLSLKKGDGQIGQQFLDEAFSRVQQGTSYISKVAVELNQLLLNNGLSAKKYGIKFLSSDNQTMFNDDGTFSSRVMKAIEDLNSIPGTVDVKTWMDSGHTVSDLVNEALIPIDLSDNPLSSPKPIIDLSEDGVTYSTVDWFRDFQKNDILPDEIATEIADEIIANTLRSGPKSEAMNHPKVIARLNEFLKVNPDMELTIRPIIDALTNCK